MEERLWNPLILARRLYSSNARARRAGIFRAQFRYLNNQKVLDLGGGKGDYIAKVLPDYKNITVADMNDSALKIAREQLGYQTIKLDGTNRLPINDNQYDIIYCNSVIEHVTGPKDTVVKIKDKSKFEETAWQHQKQFAEEIRRIGRGYFVQTPYKWFWIESHTITPVFVQLFPRWLQIFCYNLVPKKKTTPDFNLLTVRDMRELFPDAELIYERSMGMIKSIIAVKLLQ